MNARHPILVANAEVSGVAGLDVRLERGRIAAIGRGLPRNGNEIVDAAGGALIPGLIDHHLHLHAMAADAASVRCGPPDVRTAAQLRSALARHAESSRGWIRGVGYFESVAGALDAGALDRLHSRRPVRIQHRSGAMWMLNSLAVTETGLNSAEHDGVERGPDGLATGRVWRADDWLRTRLPASTPPALDDVGLTLSRLGITCVTDATPDLSVESMRAIAMAVGTGALPQHVQLLGVPLGVEEAEAEPRMSTGPYKIVLGDSDLPDLDDLTGKIADAHRIGRAVAVHCVSREALAILLAVLDEVGAFPGDRIEHGALIPPEVFGHIRALGLRVVTQPGFLAHRGDDYLREVDLMDLPDLYRCRSLIDADIPVALSSDAPYGPLDPWRVMAAARGRRDANGTTIGVAEQISGSAALNSYLGPMDSPGGPPRRVTTGMRADIVLLHTPLVEALNAPDAACVRRTFLSGRR